MVQGKIYRISKIFEIYESFRFVRKYERLLQNVDKSDYRIIAYNSRGYVIELFWSGMAKDEDWIAAYSDIANICERIEK